MAAFDGEIQQRWSLLLKGKGSKCKHRCLHFDARQAPRLGVLQGGVQHVA